MRILGMTALLTEVNTTIKWAIANFAAAEATGPLLFRSVVVHRLTIHFIPPGAAQHFSSHFPTIALSVDFDLAGTTQAFVTWK